MAKRGRKPAKYPSGLALEYMLLKESGMSYRAIAKRFEVSFQAVYHTIKYWKDPEYRKQHMSERWDR